MTCQKYTKYKTSPGNMAYNMLKMQMHILGKLIGQTVFPNFLDLFECWGKVRLPSGHILRSALMELPESENKRYYHWFKAKVNGKYIFGEAIAFYAFKFQDCIKQITLYNPLVKEEIKFKVTICGEWSTEILAIDISNIEGIVGIWRVPASRSVYILQKHPGLEILTPDEAGSEELEESGDLGAENVV
ncbi:hypothetical protein Clacol_004949 [Clathrus columnatus]|uniref:Uncharacterized protein n=1 Tax=Clathrus columnatus TaxID=1419009 RepID=A0AAV5AAW7_9AGAM|nr:hypothetical protein Clacol_004949 [Clathrus columnatus]